MRQAVGRVCKIRNRRSSGIYTLEHTARNPCLQFMAHAPMGAWPGVAAAAAAGGTLGAAALAAVVTGEGAPDDVCAAAACCAAAWFCAHGTVRPLFAPCSTNKQPTVLCFSLAWCARSSESFPCLSQEAANRQPCRATCSAGAVWIVQRAAWRARLRTTLAMPSPGTWPRGAQPCQDTLCIFHTDVDRIRTRYASSCTASNFRAQGRSGLQSVRGPGVPGTRAGRPCPRSRSGAPASPGPRAHQASAPPQVPSQRMLGTTSKHAAPCKQHAF